MTPGGRGVRGGPRRDFLPAWQRPFADLDQALDIGYGVTNSQPTTVRNMLALLDPQPGDRVLDVGSGSGWTTALLAHLVGPTAPWSVSSGSPSWSRRAGPTWVTGPRRPERPLRPSRGCWAGPREAPYDRVLVSAAAHAVPPALLEQLAVGGVLVAPVDGVMTRVVLSPEGPVVEQHGRYLFVPLIED